MVQAFTTFLYEWQTALTGLLGFGAAIWAVWFAFQSESRKSAKELEALRRSLGVEVRQCTLSALNAHRGMRRLAQTRGTPVTSRMVESFARLPEPIIYRACADRVGLLDAQAMDVAILYSQMEVVRAGIEQILRHRTPDNIPALPLATVAHALMVVAEYGSNVLPSLKTKVTQVDSRDAQLIETIMHEGSQWKVALQEWPEVGNAFNRSHA